MVHYPAYRAVGWVATGITKGEQDSLATVKVFAAILLFPVTWAAVVMAAWRWWGPRAAALAVPLLPLLGYAALLFAE